MLAGNLARLLAVLGAEVHFLPLLAVGQEEIKAPPGQRRRLLIFLRDPDAGFPETTDPGFLSPLLGKALGKLLPAEQAHGRVDLPVARLERLAGEVAFVEKEKLLREVDDMPAALLVEAAAGGDGFFVGGVADPLLGVRGGGLAGG